MELSTMLRLFLFWTFISVIGAPKAQEFTLERTDKSEIKYYLTQQKGNALDKVLLLVVQGSDCNSVLHIESIKNDYKNIWPQADLLLIEKYGINSRLSYSSALKRKDCPKDYIHNNNPKQRISDIKAVLEDVFKHHSYSKFIVLGGSEGAVIANLLAADVDYVDATISFNGGGRWFIDDVMYSILSTEQSPESAKSNSESFKEFATHLLASQPYALEVSGHGYTWWHQTLSIDQLEVLQSVSSPLLLLQGSSDTSVSPLKVDEMASALKRSGKDNITYKVYEDLDHGFTDREGQSQRETVIADIQVWLKSVLSNPNHRIKSPLKSAAGTSKLRGD